MTESGFTDNDYELNTVDLFKSPRRCALGTPSNNTRRDECVHKTPSIKSQTRARTCVKSTSIL